MDAIRSGEHGDAAPFAELNPVQAKEWIKEAGASMSLQAAALWQSKGEVFKQEYQQKLESFLSQAIQLLPEVTKVRDEAVHILSQLQKAEGGNSLAIFEINKRLQALESKQNQ